MGFLDRRREARILCVLGVGEINGQSCPDTYLLDISSIGAQLETGYSLTIGEAVEFGLPQMAEAPEEKGGYRIAGRVVWVKEAVPDPKRFRIGLSFFTPCSETTKILEKFRYRLV
jgi:hypothetical protein